MTKFPLSLAQLATFCGAQVVGDANQLVEGICSLEQQKTNYLAYIASSAGLRKIQPGNNTFYLLKPRDADKINHGLTHDNPTQAFRLILTALQQAAAPVPYCAPTAQIADNAVIGDAVHIGHHVIIEDNVSIGNHCVIDSHSVIRHGCHIGNATRLGSGVSIHHDCYIGEHCVIADNVVIGGQGFGFSFEGGRWQAIPQIGRVIIGNAVHIGANSCIDRGAINDTLIDDNVIIDNLVHIAHNVHIGEGSAMAAQVGIAGSTSIGKHCLLGGQVGIVGHISLTDGVQINGGARVLQTIQQPGGYAGSFHVQPTSQWNRIIVYVKRLETLFKREKNRE